MYLVSANTKNGSNLVSANTNCVSLLKNSILSIDENMCGDIIRSLYVCRCRDPLCRIDSIFHQT